MSGGQAGAGECLPMHAHTHAPYLFMTSPPTSLALQPSTHPPSAAEWALDCLRVLLEANMQQNLQLVVNVAKEYTEQVRTLGTLWVCGGASCCRPAAIAGLQPGVCGGGAWPQRSTLLALDPPAPLPALHPLNPPPRVRRSSPPRAADRGEDHRAAGEPQVLPRPLLLPRLLHRLFGEPRGGRLREDSQMGSSMTQLAQSMVVS